MSEAFTKFEERLQSLERKHQELAKGYVAKLNPDGLITVEPKLRGAGVKLKFIACVLLGGLLFKSTTLAIIGQATYESRVETLAAGTWLEQACAWIMKVDPLTSTVATFLNSTFG